MQGRVLIIAGSDSGGGAGIQGDIKTVTALDGYAATAVTALTAQNTRGVAAVEPVAPAFIAKQIDVILSDIGADAIKTGMLHNAEVIEAVCDALEVAVSIPLVVDPVMVAKGSERLLDVDAVATLKRRLIVGARIITPNVPEAEALTGMDIDDLETMQHAAEMLVTLGPKAVLVKGGHLAGNVVTDIYIDDDGANERFENPRINTLHTHGTGCALASAIAISLAQGMQMLDAVRRARAYVYKAILSAPGLGSGHGPLNHAHTVTKFTE